MPPDGGYGEDDEDDEDDGPPLTRAASISSEPSASSPRANELVVQEMASFKISNDSLGRNAGGE